MFGNFVRLSRPCSAGMVSLTRVRSVLTLCQHSRRLLTQQTRQEPAEQAPTLTAPDSTMTKDELKQEISTVIQSEMKQAQKQYFHEQEQHQRHHHYSGYSGSFRNPFRMASYSFSLLISMVLFPIVLWPLMDHRILPWVVARALTRGSCCDPSNETSEIWGRDREMQELRQLAESKDRPHQIWALTGRANTGKSTLIRSLASQRTGVLFIDLRRFFDGNAFVFELIDSLYNSDTNGTLGLLIASYVKLFTFVTALMASSDSRTVAMLYFHAMLNHLRSGIALYNRAQSSESNSKSPFPLPLIILDHSEALPQAMQHCQQSKELLRFIMHSLGQFATSVCHDRGMARVLFVGDDAAQSDCLDSYLYTAPDHCRVWRLGGVTEQDAREHIRLTLDCNNDTEENTIEQLLEWCRNGNPDGLLIPAEVDHAVGQFLKLGTLPTTKGDPKGQTSEAPLLGHSNW